MLSIEIDGSYGEGGGQIIRTALTLSAITQKPMRISNIRAGRPNPGLQMQHLTAAKAVRNVCRGMLEKAELRSTELIFHPGKIVGGKYEFDIGTAGSVTLVAQTIIPILLFASKKSELRIIGGTHVMKSPGYDYFEKVLIPAVSRFGVDVETQMIKPGYYPKGGGIIDVKINPSEPKGCTDWYSEEIIHALIRISGLPTSIAIREKKIFVQNEIEKIFIRENDALSVGNAVTAWKGLRGSYVLGEKGKRAEIVAQEALDELNIDCDVDMHLADQLLIYAALAKGETKYTTDKITEHLKTNSYIISQFLDRKITIDGEMILVQ
ncbi:RNA 3'-phosphate cyclase [Candidatus Micrarchaeota archaeon]|nr:RNA 3'-phosphate cyclase [Candidatus Micrarchaeota archaeon]